MSRALDTVDDNYNSDVVSGTNCNSDVTSVTNDNSDVTSGTNDNSDVTSGTNNNSDVTSGKNDNSDVTPDINYNSDVTSAANYNSDVTSATNSDSYRSEENRIGWPGDKENNNTRLDGPDSNTENSSERGDPVNPGTERRNHHKTGTSTGNSDGDNTDDNTNDNTDSNNSVDVTGSDSCHVVSTGLKPEVNINCDIKSIDRSAEGKVRDPGENSSVNSLNDSDVKNKRTSLEGKVKDSGDNSSVNSVTDSDVKSKQTSLEGKVKDSGENSSVNSLNDSIERCDSGRSDKDNIELKEYPNKVDTHLNRNKDQIDQVEDKNLDSDNQVGTRDKMADSSNSDHQVDERQQMSPSGGVLDENENPQNGRAAQDGATTTGSNNNNRKRKSGEFQEVALTSVPVATPGDGEQNDEMDRLQVPDVEKGRDDPDGFSLYSLYMVPDLRYYFQHPYARLFIAYLITFLNFYMFAEDPIAHSKAQATIPVLGNCYCFIVRKYPPNAWSFLKVLMWVSAIVLGCFIGKKVVHQILLQKKLRLKMFAEDQGSWLVMAATTLMVLFITSWIYNLFLLAGGESTEPYRIDAYLGMTNGTFTRFAATGTWSGDFITAWIVTDMMLQDKLYPRFARWIRSWWSEGYKRIFIFWGVTFAAFFIVLLVIATDWINWDTLNASFVATNEASRAFLASFILVMDLIIVMQDWDFPHFINVLDIKLPGLNTANVKFRVPKVIRKHKWEVHITGKWMNYGIIIIVMLLDLNMWQTQMFYSPFKYAQYTGPDSRIYSVRDEASMSHNETYLNYEWRANNTNPETNQTYVMGDHVTNSKRVGYGLGVTCLAFIPSVGAFIAFIFFIMYFGREKPSKEDPHAGRLKKRKKKRSRFSFKKFRRSFTRRKDRGMRGSEPYSQRGSAVRGSGGPAGGGPAGDGGPGGEGRGDGRRERSLSPDIPSVTISEA